MKSVPRPFPISLAAHQAEAGDATNDAAGAAAIRPSLNSLRGTVVAVGFSLMVRAATFLRGCNY